MNGAAPDSPCANVCVLDPRTGYCIGCGRTAAEIDAWASYDAPERAEIRAALPDRIAAMTSRHVRNGSRRRRDG